MPSPHDTLSQNPQRGHRGAPSLFTNTRLHLGQTHTSSFISNALSIVLNVMRSVYWTPRCSPTVFRYPSHHGFFSSVGGGRSFWGLRFPWTLRAACLCLTTFPFRRCCPRFFIGSLRGIQTGISNRRSRIVGRVLAPTVPSRYGKIYLVTLLYLVNPSSIL